MEKSQIDPAPIVFFAYKRPWHTRLSLQSLKRNHLSDRSVLYVFIDGPKANASVSDKEAIEEVKKIVREEQWCQNVIIHEASNNKGLAQSVMHGVSQIIREHKRVIVLEDDLVTDEYFLQFMNEALVLYEKDDSVACISGYTYPVKETLPSSFFLKGADCWGWATWQRAWEQINTNGKTLLTELLQKQAGREFDFDNTYPYTQMLIDRIEGKNDSWAILWYASMFLKNKLCLYPGHSLIQNIGNDGTGTHSGTTSKFETALHNKPLPVKRIALREDEIYKKTFTRYFKSLHQHNGKRGWMTRIKELVPDPIKSALKKPIQLFRKKTEEYGWSGNYGSWAEVQKLSEGYSHDLILQKVKEGVLKVKRGEASFERDSVTFDTLQYSERLLNCFHKIASENAGNLSVLDFGGSLGSSFFQYRQVLKHVNLTWKVVEQAHFVHSGREDIQEQGLEFFETIEQAQEKNPCQVLFLSSVLAYLPEPYVFLETAMKFNFKYILLYRTAFIEGNQDRLTLQKVPPQIYKASYPAWFLSENKLVTLLEKKYKLVQSFEGDIETSLQLKDQRAYWKGLLFEIKS